MTKQLMPLDYVKIIFRRKWFIIIPVVAGIILGMVAANVLPKTFESSTLILVEEGRIINPIINGIAVSTSTAQRLAVLREQILGWDRLLQLIQSLNLAKDMKTQQQFEDLVKGLRKNIIVKLRGTSIISISFQGKDPVQSQNIVKTITDIFIAENLRQQTKETEDAVTFINEEVKLYEKKLKQSEIANMEDQLNKLLVDSTPKHPLVIELQKKITAAKKELEVGNYALGTVKPANNQEQELQELQAELEQLKQQEQEQPQSGIAAGNRVKSATTSNEKLYKVLLMERLDKVQARDTDVTQKLYNELLSRLETAKITQRLESSKEGTRYTILDPARLPLKPIKPNKIVMLLMGMFLGLSSGIGIIALVELFDHSFLGVDEARGYLEFPVFGAISKIVTQKDIAEQKLKNTRITGISIVTGVVLLILIIFNVFLGS